jgi:chromosome segregation ATPase
MSGETDGPGSEGFGAQVEAAERRLREAAEAAAAAEERATAEIRALEADLERERQRSTDELEELRRGHEAALAEEREARQQAISAAEARLAELEAQAEAAERRVAEAQRQAASQPDAAVAGGEARARESAAAWLRAQIEAIRREAAGR